jgi:hypothetical protein
MKRRQFARLIARNILATLLVGSAARGSKTTRIASRCDCRKRGVILD